MKRLKQTLLILSFSLLGLSCAEDRNITKLQYLPDMADAPTTKPQESFLNPPEHSVAINAIIYPKTPEDSEKLLQNPFAGNPREEFHTKEGDKIWHIYCRTCHGVEGKGKGLINDKYIPTPDLTVDAYQKRGDGFFFHKITFGSAIMPSFGHSISPHERWQAILHLRKLQKAAK